MSQTALGILSLLIAFPLLVFWVWMFQVMLNNRDLPDDVKDTWTLAFVFMNVFAAVYYYVNIST